MENIIQRFFKISWRLYSWKVSLTITVMSFIGYMAMSLASNSVFRVSNAVIKKDLEALGFFDFVSNIYSFIYITLHKIIPLGDIGLGIMTMLAMGSLVTLAFAWMCWLSFEFSLFVTVYIFKKDRKAVLKDLVNKFETHFPVKK